MLGRPKPTSQHMRVIVDLSWPEGEAVNSPFSSSMYLYSQCHLQYPTINQMVDSVVQAESKGQYYLFKLGASLPQFEGGSFGLSFTWFVLE